MERLTKPLFIFLLLSISISASVFMIIESGSFFQDLYKAESSLSFMGYWAAFLNEVFMGIMAAVWIPGKKNKLGESLHPINVLFKLLLIFLFVTTVCGSSLKTAYPLYATVQKQNNQKEVIKVLHSQINDNNKSLNAFVLQNQRTNAALSVRNQIKIKEELKQMLANQESTFGLWLEISIIILIRFGVQLANLSCIWLAGWVYRQPSKTRNNNTELKRDQQFRAKTKHQKALNVALEPDSGSASKTNGSTFNSRPKQANKYTTSYKQNSVAEKHKQIPSKNTDVQTKPAEEQILKQDKDQGKIYDLRVKIARLLRSRNEGISLSDIGKAIGEREASLREIVNPKLSLGSETMPALEDILSKIENLYNEEQIRMS
ncbi:MAG: hypothetical protein MJE63_13775 [Proteobacteria bacterium]|nr:hypothetical protein [Pseudomonadota bacterium]